MLVCLVDAPDVVHIFELFVQSGVLITLIFIKQLNDIQLRLIGGVRLGLSSYDLCNNSDFSISFSELESVLL